MPLCELIDTWWDVNKQNAPTGARHWRELIDTWWDVNTFWTVGSL